MTTKQSVIRVGIKLFFKLCEYWDLNELDTQRLAGGDSETIEDWYAILKGTNDDPVYIDDQLLARLSLLAGIQKGIEILIPSAEWRDYVYKPNLEFGGRSIIEKLLNGTVDDFYDVRRYLDTYL